MKKKLGMAGALALALVLGACVSMGKEMVETETSKMLLNAANDVLLAKESGLQPDQFARLFEQKVPGVAFSSAALGGQIGNALLGANTYEEELLLTYKEKTYYLRVFKDAATRRFTSATACAEAIEKEK